MDTIYLFDKENFIYGFFVDNSERNESFQNSILSISYQGNLINPGWLAWPAWPFWLAESSTYWITGVVKIEQQNFKKLEIVGK